MPHIILRKLCAFARWMIFLFIVLCLSAYFQPGNRVLLCWPINDLMPQSNLCKPVACGMLQPEHHEGDRFSLFTMTRQRESWNYQFYCDCAYDPTLLECDRRRFTFPEDMKNVHFDLVIERYELFQKKQYFDGLWLLTQYATPRQFDVRPYASR